MSTLDLAKADPRLRKFFAKVDFEDNGCWVWTAAKCRGYGQFFPGRDALTTGRATVYAHRWIWEQVNGPIPEGLVIDHLCENPPCVNPAHLEPVTRGENTLRWRRWQGGTCGKGHPLNEKNLKVNRTTGVRKCRECLNIWQRKYRERKKS